VLEVFLDISRLTEKDTLLIVNEHGVCDVLDYLKDCRSLRYSLREPKTRCGEILLERWKIEHTPAVPEPDQDFSYVLPKFYKQCVIHLRALYTIASLLPTWRLWNQIKKEELSSSPLAIRCRIGASSEDGENETDMLSQPVFSDESSAVTDQVVPSNIQMPLGSLSAKVSYRKECRFFVRSDHRSDARIPVGRKGRSLSRGDDSQHHRSQRRIRSTSLPGETMGSDESSLRQLNRSFSTLDMGEEASSTLVNPDDEISFENSRDAERFGVKNLLSRLSIQKPRNEGTSALAEALSIALCGPGVPTLSRGAPVIPEDYSMVTDLSMRARYTSSFTHRRRNVFHASEQIDDSQGTRAADPERGRPSTTGQGTGPRPRRDSSANSNASSGRGSSPASLRNISLAPKEFDPSVPTLRHSYSSPDLQDWSNVQARHSRQNSASPAPDKV
jgi:hypothetical protein